MLNLVKGLIPSFLAGAALLVSTCTFTSASADDKQWVVFEGKDGPGKGKNLVLIAGDDEYFSEEGLPILAKILAERHGFTCTMLWSINKTTGVIDTDTHDNIPGLEALEHADGLILFTRFRDLPDQQMKRILDYTDSGHGIIGMRTATHGFALSGSSAYAKYTWNSTVPGFEGGFGRLILGETWINHHGGHGSESTRGLIAPGAETSPLVRGIKSGDIWCSTDVYEVRLPMLAGITPIIMGQVLTGMDPNDKPLPGSKNEPMMPVAWTRTYTGTTGKPARVFATTMGGAMSGHHDWDNEALRRLLVNATYWITGLEAKIPAKANVDVVGENHFKRGVKPQDVQ